MLFFMLIQLENNLIYYFYIFYLIIKNENIKIILNYIKDITIMFWTVVTFFTIFSFVFML